MRCTACAVLFLLAQQTPVQATRSQSKAPIEGNEAPQSEATIENDGLIVKMQGKYQIKTYQIEELCNTMKDIRGLSKAMRDELSKVKKNGNQERQSLGNRLADTVTAYVNPLTWLGATMLDSLFKEKDPMVMVLRVALGTIYSREAAEPVRKIVHNLLLMDTLTSNYEASPSQKRGLMFADYMKAIFRVKKNDVAQKKRQVEINTVSEFLEGLQGVSNQKEVLEGWKYDAAGQTYYHLGAMIRLLTDEAKIWNKLGVHHPRY